MQQVSVFDRGFQYGDGFFTTIAVYQQRLVNWPAHWQRIETSLQRLNMSSLSEEKVLETLEPYLQSSVTPFSVLKLIVSRGLGGKGYTPPGIEQTELKLVVLDSAFPMKVDAPDQWPMQIVTACLNEVAYGLQPLLAGIKHLNRLENVLARQGMPATCHESIMLDLNGKVISGTQSNICLVKGKTLFTPKLTYSGVQGTFLTSLFSYLQKKGWHCQYAEMTLEALHEADEVFFCNAVRGIMPVQQLERSKFAIDESTRIHQRFTQFLMESTCKN